VNHPEERVQHSEHINFEINHTLYDISLPTFCDFSVSYVKPSLSKHWSEYNHILLPHPVYVCAVTGVTLVICMCRRQTVGFCKSAAWLMEPGRIIHKGHNRGMVYVLHHLWQFS
jgi:hypothetical protein